MTLVHDAFVRGQPGTHVLAIGVGNYPHLLGGSQALANKPLGLKQLQSPPVSLKAVLDWFLAPAPAGFENASARLSSIEALASAAVPVIIDTPAGVTTLDAATRQNIQASFEA